jgi:O-antigen/teichoic acid export membrane protein
MVFSYVASDARDAGMFAAAMALATPASMLAQAVSQALIPRFSEWAHADPGGAVARYRPVLGVMVVVLAVAFGAVAVVAPWLVPLLYGPGFDDAVGFLRLLLLGVFLFSVGVIASSFLITTGRAVSAAVAAGIGTACGLAVMLAAAPALGGSVAAGWGVAAGSGVTAIAVVASSIAGVVKPGRGEDRG